MALVSHNAAITRRKPFTNSFYDSVTYGLSLFGLVENGFFLFYFIPVENGSKTVCTVYPPSPVVHDNNLRKYLVVLNLVGL